MTYVLENETLTISLEGKIIMSNSDDLKNQLKEEISKHRKKMDFKEFVLDLKNVDFVDSTGVGIFISLYKFALEHQLIMKIANPQNMVTKIFTITKLDTLIPLV